MGCSSIDSAILIVEATNVYSDEFGACSSNFDELRGLVKMEKFAIPDIVFGTSGWLGTVS